MHSLRNNYCKYILIRSTTKKAQAYVNVSHGETSLSNSQEKVQNKLNRLNLTNCTI